ncbi:DUF2142 domain-containing protein [Kitasatospora sp. NBC_00240]|uniref:DUF2142 domain-containing protein n=1 Tax=Kitasatospora sp. NBC_00240 TaxID=2903567 RepID=UPI00225BD217|nr:DUF2142 domain-containing protein [Kitasatospora sp. NBC_00240]MCX5212367.1 DUF2142 domain-containing protein [Kitasatospora sp. NBC_00240]
MTNTMKRLADRLMKTPRRLWVVSFVLFFMLGGAFSLSTPMGASPDEHAHIIRAAAVARGQLGGTEVMVPHRVASIDGNFAETGVQLPAWYEDLKTINSCYVFHPERSAGCAPGLASSEKQITEVTTAAGRYNPAYYLAVGWTSRVLDGVSGLYLMRLASAAIGAALLASAVVSAAEWHRRSITVLGVLAAATPMSLFMIGMVNPSGAEIAAGILVWSAVLPILMSPDPKLLTRRLARLGIGATVLISIRPLGIIWFLGAVIGGLLLQESGALRAVLRRRAAWLWTLALGATSAAALAWTALHPDHSVIDTPSDLTTLKAARWTFDSSLTYIRQMIGYFGWLDTPTPAATLLIWSTVVMMLAMLALCFARVRETVALLGSLVGIIMVPVVAQGIQAPQLGMIWQGRYLLPFAVGLPIMAAAICVKRSPVTGVPWRRLVALSAFSLSLANMAGFVWALRRNTAGTDGSFFLLHAHWSPPGSWLLWIVVYGAAALLLTLFVMADDRSLTPAGSQLGLGRAIGRRGQRKVAPAA